MNLRTITAFLVILLLLIVGAIVWAHYHNKNQNTTATLPVLSVSSFNQTKNNSATAVTAEPGDTLVFTLTAENKTDKVIPGYIMEANIADISTNATLTDANGASYNSATNSLVWTPLDINPNESIQKKVTVRVNPLPVTSNSGTLKMKFNNEVTINVASKAVAQTPPPSNPGKVAGAQGQSNYQAPVSGASENVILVMAVISTLGFWFYHRRKVLKA